MTVGSSEILRATVEPSDAANGTVTWSSSNPATATVGKGNGLVKALAEGTATITVTATDGGFTDVCEVTVTEAEVAISLNRTTLTLMGGDTETLRATIEPLSAGLTATWTSSDPAVATVGKTSGLVTAIAPGPAEITATAGGKSASCALTVEERIIPVEKVALSKTSMSLTQFEFETLTFSIEPFNATDRSVTWKSSNDNVATVVGGKVTGTGKGTASITVTTTSGGKTDVCIVTVAEASPIIVADENLAGKYTWDQAMTACPAGWRLPTREELEPLCPLRNNYNGFQDGKYWTSDEKESNPSTAYVVLFSSMERCFNGYDYSKTEQNFVRCVQPRN
jgi:uncharacterized protein YjdB